jgi:hypothetical protein
MNQFLRSFLLLSLFATTGQLPLHATAHDDSIYSSNCLYTIIVEHGYKRDPKKIVHISANDIPSLIDRCAEEIVNNSGKNDKYQLYSINITCSQTNYKKHHNDDGRVKSIQYKLEINFADCLAVGCISEEIANDICRFFGCDIDIAQSIFKVAFAFHYKNKS